MQRKRNSHVATVGYAMLSAGLSIVGNHVPAAIGGWMIIGSFFMLALAAFPGERWIKEQWKRTPVASIFILITLIGVATFLVLNAIPFYSRVEQAASDPCTPNVRSQKLGGQLCRYRDEIEWSRDSAEPPTRDLIQKKWTDQTQDYLSQLTDPSCAADFSVASKNLGKEKDPFSAYSNERIDTLSDEVSAIDRCIRRMEKEK
jgi:hypothetical protein